MQLTLAAGARVLVACSLVACSHHDDTTSDAGNDASTCGAGALGNPNAPIDFQITSPGDTADVVLNEGSTVPIALPPQGGRVIFLGVRATNLEACSVQLSGALRDEATNQVRIDARTVNLVAAGDGWGTSAIQGTSPSSQLASYSNVPVCPNEWASTDVFDHTFRVEVTLTDRHGRSATKSVHVVPKCVDDIQYSRCQCICIKGYVLGQSCDDAGAPDASVD